MTRVGLCIWLGLVLAFPAAAHEVIRRELAAHSPELAARPTVTVATKMDDPTAVAGADALESAVGEPVLRISAVTGAGLAELFRAVDRYLGDPGGD